MHSSRLAALRNRQFCPHLFTDFWPQRVLPSEFFKVLGSAIDSKTFVTGQTSLKDALLQDTLSRAPDNEAEYYQLVLDNLCSFVEAAQISHLSADVLQCELYSAWFRSLTHDDAVVGLSLTNIAYKVAEWPIDSFDASSLLTTIAVLIQNNKAHSRVCCLRSTHAGANIFPGFPSPCNDSHASAYIEM